MSTNSASGSLPRRGNLSIRYIAEDFLNNNGVMPKKSDETVDLNEVLGALNFKYYEFNPKEYPNFSDIRGAVDHTTKRIFINKSLDIQEKKFALAHEVGHAILHKGQNKVDFLHDNWDKLSAEEKEKEIEANVFAYELLMPIDQFKANQIKFNINQLSNIYNLTKRRVEKRVEYEKKLINDVEEYMNTRVEYV